MGVIKCNLCLLIAVHSSLPFFLSSRQKQYILCVREPQGHTFKVKVEHDDWENKTTNQQQLTTKTESCEWSVTLGPQY